MYKVNFNYSYHVELKDAALNVQMEKVVSPNKIIYTKEKTLSAIEKVVIDYIIEEAKEKRNKKLKFQLLEVQINKLKKIKGIIR